jgi:hypothetical protein
MTRRLATLPVLASVIVAFLAVLVAVLLVREVFPRCKQQGRGKRSPRSTDHLEAQ